MGFSDKFCAIWGEIFKILPKNALKWVMTPLTSRIKTHITEMRKRFSVIISPPHLYTKEAHLLPLYIA